MRRLALLLAVFLGSLAAAAGGGEPANVRASAFAGAFYPAEPGALRGAIEAFLADARPAGRDAPLALVVPHAGYLYSGQVAADAYRQAAPFAYDVVVVLGTDHTVAPFDGVSVDPAPGYRTPLGVVATDFELVRALRGAEGTVSFLPAAHAREHSLEVQLPFVQVVFPGARVVTAVVGSPEPALAEHFGRALAKALRGRRGLIVASSDLSHYPPREVAAAPDHATLAAVASLDPAAAAETFARLETGGAPGLLTAACGQGPILAAMTAARALGARRGVVASYANSGDTVAGDGDRVVGYGAVAFTAGAGPADLGALATPPAPPSRTRLGAEERAELLALARATVERWLRTGTLPLPRPVSPRLERPQGAFVTLLEQGELRGCLGHLVEDTPLALTVARMALAAATHDPRFRAVTAAELPSLVVEISVLSPIAAVPGPEAITVGRDGVLLARDGRQAVFLPQVAPEQGWARDEMLDHLCAKAGMAHDCWRRGAALSTFQAEVFREPGEP